MANGLWCATWRYPSATRLCGASSTKYMSMRGQQRLRVVMYKAARSITRQTASEHSSIKVDGLQLCNLRAAVSYHISLCELESLGTVRLVEFTSNVSWRLCAPVALWGRRVARRESRVTTSIRP
eukprot:6125586-Prymnesium_polylepis.2